MSIILKIIKAVLLFLCILVILSFGVMIYLKPQWQKKCSPNEMSSYVEHVKSAPPANSSFFKLYKRLYSERLENGYLTSKLTSGGSSICSQMASEKTFNMPIPQRISFYYELESRLTQEECFNCFFKEYLFDYGSIGIEDASYCFFNKTLHNLDLEEQLTLIAMLKNPIFYNLQERPELTLREVNKLMRRLEQSTN